MKLQQRTMRRNLLWCVLVASTLAGIVVRPPGAASEPTVTNPPPEPKDWSALASLPDWSGVWTPNMTDQQRRIKTDPVPWNKAAAAQIAKLEAAEQAGDPKGLFINCLPESMPSWMLLTHNALEFLFTPGRVTMLGESDGNRLRRIYTDGRGHPADPDPTFHGHSIGHWEGDTLVVDTTNFTGKTRFRGSSANLHVVERFRRVDANTILYRATVDDPSAFAKPWTLEYPFVSTAGPVYEYACHEGNYAMTDILGGARRMESEPEKK
jgi:hypothetical protein